MFDTLAREVFMPQIRRQRNQAFVAYGSCRKTAEKSVKTTELRR